MTDIESGLAGTARFGTRVRGDGLTTLRSFASMRAEQKAEAI
jgi:hypothetical protein